MLANTDRHKRNFMQAVEFNEWDFYPINLKPNEINNLSLVFAAFFYDDWLPDQLERLKEWRDYVLKNEYYLDNKKSPFGLLYFHKLNVCLIEAVHLIKESGGCLASVQQTENLMHEKEIWHDYPSNLTAVELLDPNLLIKAFFEDYNLPQYRSNLCEWLEYGLSSKAANEFMETSDLIRVYENLQKLYSAAWLIHQRSSDHPYLKELSSDTSQIEIDKLANVGFEEPALDAVTVYPLNNAMPTTDEERICRLITVIKHKVPSVQAVIYLGIIPNQADSIFLLVLTANDEQRQAQSLSSTIEESCSDIAHVVTLVHHASSMLTGYTNNNIFFNRALTCPVVYLSGDLLLPVTKPLNQYNPNETPMLKWERWHNQGKD